MGFFSSHARDQSALKGHKDRPVPQVLMASLALKVRKVNLALKVRKVNLALKVRKVNLALKVRKVNLVWQGQAWT